MDVELHRPLETLNDKMAPEVLQADRIVMKTTVLILHLSGRHAANQFAHY